MDLVSEISKIEREVMALKTFQGRPGYAVPTVARIPSGGDIDLSFSFTALENIAFFNVNASHNSELAMLRCAIFYRINGGNWISEPLNLVRADFGIKYYQEIDDMDGVTRWRAVILRNRAVGAATIDVKCLVWGSDSVTVNISDLEISY